MVRVAETALRVEPYIQPAEAKPSSPLRRYEVGGLVRAPGTPNRLVKPAELAQAHIFKSTLHDELARLNRLANRLGGPADQPSSSNSAGEDRELAHLHACIDEVRRMLEGLRGRFGTTD